MLQIHKSGLVITERKEHFKRYDGDARYVVWNVDSPKKPTVFQQASYLPTLLRWLDMKYPATDTARVKKAERNIKLILKGQ